MCPVTKRREKRKAKPLDPPLLRALAFAYVARFATSRARLAGYLGRKLAERGWAGEASPNVAALVAEMADKAYLDDAAYAAMKAGSLTRRGYGARRVTQMYFADGIAEDDRADAAEIVDDGRIEAAIALARRRRFGPFGERVVDDDTRRRQLAAMLRAGHGFAIADRLLRLGPEWRDRALAERLAE